MCNELLLQKNLKNFNIADYAYTEIATPTSTDFFNHWIEKGLHKPLKYLINEKQQTRQNLTNYFPAFKSALIFLFPYTLYSSSRISSFTLGFNGRDYHNLITEQLTALALLLKLDNTKTVVDTAPVLERDLAFRAGLGWFGKNSMLINKKFGSSFIIAALFLPYKLHFPTKYPDTDHCGSCTCCIDACPTKAILPNRTLIAQKCISTFTIEIFKEASAPKGFSNEIFGCDICQTVCPWNRPQKKIKSTPLIEFFLNRPIGEVISELETMSNRKFKKLFFDTSIQRSGRVGILKNLKAQKLLNK